MFTWRRSNEQFSIDNRTKSYVVDEYVARFNGEDWKSEGRIIGF